MDGVLYTICGGEIFTVFPWETHDTGGNPEEKAVFYYLIADLEALCQQYHMILPLESAHIQNVFLNPEKRIQKAPKWYAEFCAQIFSLLKEEEPFKDTRIRNLLSDLLISLAMSPCRENLTVSMFPVDILGYIQNHLKESVEIVKLAELSGLSVSRFQSSFAKETGITPGEYILRKKIESCQRELILSKKTVTEIAFEYGFSSSQYFSTVFKRFCCMSPSQYRRRFDNC